MAIDLKYGRVETELEPGNPFGEDEPVFILRGRDVAAAETIALYYAVCSRIGASAEQLEGVTVARREFERWRNENPDMIKVPD